MMKTHFTQGEGDGQFAKLQLNNEIASLNCLDPKLEPMAQQMSAKAVKAMLRKECKARIAAIPKLIKESQSRRLTQMESNSFGIYLSRDDEVDTKVIIQTLLKHRKEIFVPFYKGDTMKMVPLNSWQDYERMPETAWKIKQPEDGETRLDALSLGGIEVLVCPGLAFGQNCSRLGRGKGYYDKYIETCKQKGSYPFMVGLAFNEQVTKGDLALDENDQYLSVVLYPSMHRYELPSGLKEGKTFIERNLFYTFPY
uniref:5-formyltetrahydrofolate cyclo-ligase n=1 Tax=Magallana gigas TaxID=29159 RepID=K1PXR6_MAGGI